MNLDSTASAAEQKNKTMLISGIVNEQTHALAKEVVREAYRRIGITVTFQFYPGIRSLELANMGKTDGDIARIAGTNLKFSKLLQVAVPVIHFQGVAFTKSVSKPIESWKDLENFRVGVIRGIRYSTIGTRGLNRYFADDMTHLFRLLYNDRIEVAIAVLDAGMIEIGKSYKNSGIHVIGKPLYSAPLYHFIHEKHQHLKSALEKELQEMAALGISDKILQNVRDSLKGN